MQAVYFSTATNKLRNLAPLFLHNEVLHSEFYAKNSVVKNVNAQQTHVTIQSCIIDVVDMQ